jgi:hypothetical protein
VRNTVLRRLDLLKMEGEGFSYSDIVKGLSKQYDCSERTVKYDFALRGEWKPKLSGVTETNKIIMKAANRYA